MQCPVALEADYMEESCHDNDFDCCSMDGVSVCSSSLPKKQADCQPRYASVGASPMKLVACEATPRSDPAKSAVEYVLCLRQGHHISQAGVERVIQHTDMLIKSTVSAVESRLNEFLYDNNIELNCSLSEIFQSELPPALAVLLQSHNSESNLIIILAYW